MSIPFSQNVPRDKTIERCVNELFKSSQTVSSLNKQQVFGDAFVNYKRKCYFILSKKLQSN